MLSMTIFQALIHALIVFTICYANERSYFRAAVLENTPAPITDDMTPAEIMLANLKLVEIGAKEAAKRGADIFVTSEYGIYPPGPKERTKKFADSVPDPRKGIVNPCTAKSTEEFQDALSSFSCIAKKYNMYVVANFLDIHPCSSSPQTCSADGLNCEIEEKCIEGNKMYNTDVVFNRNGDVIARYHKNHLYFELLDTPKLPEMVTFQTDFGKFGMIVCFDSLFEDAVRLVEGHNIETLLFPTHWFDDILPLNGIEWQQAWAIANKVNFLASNKHVPGNGTFGSGIFSKDFGALAYTYNPDGKSKLVISNVPRDGSSANLDSQVLLIEENEILAINEKGDSFLDNCHVDLIGPPKDMIHDHRCYKFQAHRHALKKLEKNSDEVEICHNNFCCYLNYEAESMEESYYLTAFSGENDVFDHHKWIEETCLLVRCDALGDKPCATFPSKSTTTFRSVAMKAKFKSPHVYPTVSKSLQRLAPKLEWSLQEEGNYHVLSFHSETTEPLLKIALFSRNYAEDPTFIPYYQSPNQKSRFH